MSHHPRPDHAFPTLLMPVRGARHDALEPDRLGRRLRTSWVMLQQPLMKRRRAFCSTESKHQSRYARHTQDASRVPNVSARSAAARGNIPM